MSYVSIGIGLGMLLLLFTCVRWLYKVIKRKRKIKHKEIALEETVVYSWSSGFLQVKVMLIKSNYLLPNSWRKP